VGAPGLSTALALRVQYVMLVSTGPLDVMVVPTARPTASVPLALCVLLGFTGLGGALEQPTASVPLALCVLLVFTGRGDALARLTASAQLALCVLLGFTGRGGALARLTASAPLALPVILGFIPFCVEEAVQVCALNVPMLLLNPARKSEPQLTI
jgi:hypothetical protein